MRRIDTESGSPASRDRSRPIRDAGLRRYSSATWGASRRWWTDGLGLIELAVLLGPDAPASLIHLRRHRYQDLLLVGGRLPGVPAPVGVMASCPRRTAGQARRDPRTGAEPRYRGGQRPGEIPRYAVQVIAVDPDGYTVALTAPSQRERPEEWDRMVHDSDTAGGAPERSVLRRTGR